MEKFVNEQHSNQAIIWDKVLSQIAIISSSLQAKDIDIDISDAQKLLGGLLGWLELCRQNGFKECIEIANKVANDCEIDVNSGFGTRTTRGEKSWGKSKRN